MRSRVRQIPEIEHSKILVKTVTHSWSKLTTYAEIGSATHYWILIAADAGSRGQAKRGVDRSAFGRRFLSRAECGCFEPGGTRTDRNPLDRR